MMLTVNGKTVEIEGEVPLPDFLRERGIDARHVAVAQNGDVLDRTRFGDVVLRSGDVVEIVRMIGGG
jgi:thiamine biosynthesis protein ThiS